MPCRKHISLKHRRHGHINLSQIPADRLATYQPNKALGPQLLSRHLVVTRCSPAQASVLHLDLGINRLACLVTRTSRWEMAVPEHQEEMGHPTWEAEVPEHQEEPLEEIDHLTCTAHLVAAEARHLSSLEEEVNLHKPLEVHQTS